MENLHKNTALLDAAASDNEILVKELLEAGADPNYQAANGKTALMVAAKDGHDSRFGTVELLVEAGADLSIKDNNGLTALDYANDVQDEETWKPYIAEYLSECMTASPAPSLDMHSRSSLSEQIQSASTRASDSQTPAEPPVKVPDPER